MKNLEKDQFKEALRKRIEDRPIHSENDAEIWKKVLKEVRPDTHSFYSNEYPWYSMAAGILLFLSFGLGLFLYNSDTKNNIISENIKIEKNKLIVEGRQDVLNKKIESLPLEQTPAEPEKVIKTSVANSLFANAESISVDKNVTEQKMADGSVITLNEGSSIKIDNSFKDQRNILLEGEAYFEIQPDKNKPFTVYFSDYKLVVVGTKFNVRNIDGEKSKEITVTEGIVRVFDNHVKEGIEVKRGEQLTITSGAKSILKNVESDNYISWKTGSLDFKNISLEEMSKLLSRKFDKEIILSNQIKNCKFTGDLSGLSIDDALKIISSSTSLKIEKSNHKLYISGSGCD